MRRYEHPADEPSPRWVGAAGLMSIALVIAAARLGLWLSDIIDVPRALGFVVGVAAGALASRWLLRILFAHWWRR